MQIIFNKLFNAQTLTQSESQQLFSAIIRGELTPTQLAAVLIAMKLRGEKAEEIAGAAQACLANAAYFPRPDYQFSDIVGTGGDVSNSINISTASAFVSAACGIKVAKHGSRSVSSKTGSSDLLATFGVELNASAQSAREALDKVGLCFLFAPLYHAGFRFAAPVRAEIKTRTLFNVLGPLINPARPQIGLIGVYSADLIMPIAQTLKMLGYQRAAVVHCGGMDEVSLHAPTQVAELCNGEIESYQLHASDFGLKPYEMADLRGGEPAENKIHLTSLLQGHGKTAHANAVAANVSLLMKLNGNENLKQNAEQALSTLYSGDAFERVTQLAAIQTQDVPSQLTKIPLFEEQTIATRSIA